MIADEDVVDHFPENPPPPKCGMFTLMVLLLILILVDSGVLYTCGGVQWRRKHNADKDNLGGHDNGRLQINQNWIWKKTNEV